MMGAGMDGAAILESGTAAPAARWGLEDLDRVEVGAASSLPILDADPQEDPTTLSRPLAVWTDGMLR